MENINSRDTLAFIPVQGKEEKIKNLHKQAKDGYVYFATDTKKIYCGKNGEFISMGGNSGIYYGNREFSEDETNTDQTSFIFDINQNHIEGDQIPTINDLILNEPDGSFYRVTNVYGALITAERLTVSGGGTSSGPSGTGSKPIVHDPNKGQDSYFRANDLNNMKIYYSCSSPAEDSNNYIASIRYLFAQEIITEEVSYAFGTTYYFDISKYKSKFSTVERNTLQIEVTDVYGNTSKKVTFYFYLVELELQSDATPISQINLEEGKEYIYTCKPKGGNILNNKTIQISLAPLDNPNKIIYTTSKDVTYINTDYSIPININDITDINHGVYLLTAKYTGVIKTNQTDLLFPSNVCSVQIIAYDPQIATPLIATNFNGGSITQYSKFNLIYMIAGLSNEVETNCIIYYGQNYSNEQFELNSLNNWNYTFNTTGIYEISIEYKGENVSFGFLEVKDYGGNIPQINAADAEIYLTSQGRSNTQSDREKWEYQSPKNPNKIYHTTFENFLWGNENGWIEDKFGDMALKLSNGAKIFINDYFPFREEATETGLTIELDFMVSGVLDYSKPLIHCLSTFTNALNEKEIETGFNITGQKATLNSRYYKATSTEIIGEEDENGDVNVQDMALQGFTQYFNEDSRVHLTYVISRIPDYSIIKDTDFYFVQTYLNGVLSGIMKMNVDIVGKKSDGFKDKDINNSAIFTVDSTFGDVYIYNIRVYRNALNTMDVINNYIADLTDIDKKIKLNKDNKIFSDEGLISLSAIQDLSYELQVPYILFNGGNPMEKKFNEPFVFKDDSYQLPLKKDDFRFMSMKMYDIDKYTGKTYLSKYIPIEAKDETTSEIIEKFSDLKNQTLYYPIKGVQVYGQGTSSMVYPTKNLRLKFIQQEDYPVVYDGSCPLEIVCFKADYMDSSSSHNTGTANLIYDLYKSLNMKTPPQQFQADHRGKEGVIAHDILTAIKGYPIICFYAPGDSENYEYIGRYNFNIDKATPEPFGFLPQIVKTGETVIDSLGRSRDVVFSCGVKTEIIDGKTVLPLDDDNKEIKRDIIQCWEIKNNDNKSPTKFLTPDGFNSFSTSLISGHNWTEYYEDRYPDKMVKGAAFELGDLENGKRYDNLTEDLNNGIFRVANWINSTATEEITNTFIDPVYYQTLDNDWNRDKTYYTSTGEEKIITTEKKISITETSTVDEVDKLTSLRINSELFISQVGEENYNTYAFIYNNDTGEWILNGNPVILNDYGISYNGTAIAGSGITVVFWEDNDWNSTLYEKYNIDNREYRLSKFKTEFTNYFDMKFSLFYYVLTLALLMMDSRAKNMMLASWDQTIWYPIFYDMDTMLGINNVGFNKFSFDTEDDPRDMVFNGWDSVLWNNFRECFSDNIATFYSELRSSLTLSKLLDIYNTKGADSWNEALSSADAEYKYIRPYRSGYYEGDKEELEFIKPGQISYLYAAQGRRSEHREWWLNNRLNYLDSKFIPLTYGNNKPGQNNTFSFRAYALPEQKRTLAAEECIAQTPANHKFNLTALNNSYQSVFIGNINYGPQFTSAGEIAQIGPDTVKHEVESWILNPKLISNLGDLSDKYLGSFAFPGQQTKLIELNFGRSSRSHPTAYDKYYNKLLNNLNIGTSCPYLQKLNIARCTGLRTLEIQYCTRLQELDAEGTKLTDITFPNNSILNKLYLPAETLKDLTLINQPNLSILEFDSDTLNLDSITLDNTPLVNSYNIVKKMFSGSLTTEKKFYFYNFNWTIEDDQSNMDPGNTLTQIDILEVLLSNMAQPSKEQFTKKQSLSGKIILNGNYKVDEYTIYDKYKRIWPNVEIAYGNNIDLTKAYSITFKKTSDENAENHYQVKAQPGGTQSIGTLISEDGPTGVAMTAPNDIITASNVYKFTGFWIDASDPSKKYTIDQLKGEIPSSDLTFYPDYKETIREFSVRFYDGASIIKQWDGESWVDDWKVPYNQVYDGPLTNYYYKDGSDLQDTQRYTFAGWAYSPQINYQLSDNYVKDINQLKIVNDVILYAHYTIENCLEKATKDDYFNFIEVKINVPGNQTETGYRIDIKDEYRDQLQGKITLPAKHTEKNITKDVIQIGDFKNTNKITHIFCQRGSNYLAVGEQKESIITEEQVKYSFLSSDSSLQYVLLSDTVKIIGEYAFANCFALTTINLPDGIEYIGTKAFFAKTDYQLQVNISKLPDSLSFLGDYAFTRAGNNVTFGDIPSNVERLSNWCFAYCPNLTIQYFGYGASKLTTLATGSLYGSGKNVTNIYVGANLIIFEDNNSPFSHFSGYGSSNGGTYTIENGMTAEQLKIHSSWTDGTNLF